MDLRIEVILWKREDKLGFIGEFDRKRRIGVRHHIFVGTGVPDGPFTEEL